MEGRPMTADLTKVQSLQWERVCGCQVHWYPDGRPQIWTIDECPLHAAAGDLLKVVRSYGRFLAKVKECNQEDSCMISCAFSGVTEAKKKIDALIARAKGRETVGTKNNSIRALKALQLGRLAIKHDGFNTDRIDRWIAEVEAEIRETEDSNRG